MLQEIHTKSLQITLNENQTKIDLIIKRLLILLMITCIALTLFCLIRIAKIYFLMILLLSIYSLFTGLQFYSLWKTRNKIQTKLTENKKL